MGYSLCIEAIFGNFQNALIFRILAFAKAIAHAKYLVCVLEPFFA